MWNLVQVTETIFWVLPKRRGYRDTMKWSNKKVFQMKITTFVVIFCLLVRSGVCLYCFSCSVMDTSKVGVFVNLINLGPDYHNLILFVIIKSCLTNSIFSQACPSLSSEPVAWSKNSGKMYNIGTTSTLNCALAYGVQSGQVYYQVSLTFKK